MKDFWEGFWEGFSEDFWGRARQTATVYFEPVVFTWRWLRRGAGALRRGVSWLARAGWRPKVR
jgi:hypothetical protein